jgi:hypothetical protein
MDVTSRRPSGTGRSAATIDHAFWLRPVALGVCQEESLDVQEISKGQLTSQEGQ